MKRSLIVFAIAMAVFVAGCAKKNLPSGPGSPPGTPVLLTGTPLSNNSRQISINNGKIKNQSGLTIYQIQVGVEVYRGAPFDITLDTVFNVSLDSLHDGEEGSFFVQWFFADTFLNAYPVYSFLPATP